MNQPLLHVMIPAYGKSPYLRKTLETAVKNLSSEVLISVVEDPHPEFDLKKIVDEFPRVTYFKNTHRLGVGGNFNRCIELSQGKFTQICGSDDLIIDDPTKYISNNLEEDSIAAIGFDVNIINENDKLTNPLPDKIKYLLRPKMNQIEVFKKDKIFKNLMLGDWLYFPAILWNTKLIKQFKFNENYHTAMDLDMFIKIFSNNKTIAFVKQKTLFYRRHQESESSKYAKSEGRFNEEFECHKVAIKIAKANNLNGVKFFAQLALTVRLHALFQAILIIPQSPKLAVKLFLKGISPIS
ncbi:MAG: glycosyltransferase [Candidatus Nanopelagicales bacterium]